MLLRQCEFYRLFEENTFFGLFMREHDPDIMLLVEHYLSSGHRFDIDGYRIFRRDRVGLRGGGTATFVRSTIRCENVELDTGNI